MLDLLIADLACDSSGNGAETSKHIESMQESEHNKSDIALNVVSSPNHRVGLGVYDGLDLSAMLDDDSDLHPSLLQPRSDVLPEPQALPSPRSQPQPVAIDDDVLEMPELLASSEPTLISNSNSASSDDLVGASVASIGGAAIGEKLNELRFSVEPDVDAELLPLYRRQKKMQASVGSSRDGTLNISSVRDSISLFSVHGTDLMGALADNATFAIELSVDGLAPDFESDLHLSPTHPPPAASSSSSSLGYFVLVSIPGLSLRSPDDPSHDVRLFSIS
jgi:hypothetical protein